MGKRLAQQRRGSGSPTYRAPSKRYKVDLCYRSYDDIEKTGVLRGEVVGLVDDPAHHAILMKISYENKEKGYLPAPEGIAVGDFIDVGAQGKLTLGSVLPLYRIPDGAYIYNLERSPGDGGKLVKSPGSFATIVSKEGGKVYVKLPSKAIAVVSSECRAQIGIICGGGRLEKPLLKASGSFYKHRSRSRIWPKVRGVHMSAYSHPHGGKQHHVGKPTTVSRGASPGSKVGHLAAKSTGRKKTKRTEAKKGG